MIEGSISSPSLSVSQRESDWVELAHDEEDDEEAKITALELLN